MMRLSSVFSRLACYLFVFFLHFVCMRWRAFYFQLLSCVAHLPPPRSLRQPPTANRQVLIGSNTVSNVPLVLLMAPSIAALPSAAETRCAWLLLSFVATVAGNLTLVGRCVSSRVYLVSLF